MLAIADRSAWLGGRAGAPTGSHRVLIAAVGVIRESMQYALFKIITHLADVRQNAPVRAVDPTYKLLRIHLTILEGKLTAYVLKLFGIKS